MIVTAPISVGELADKITILEIKRENFKDEEKLRNVNIELAHLRNSLKVVDQDIFDEFYSLFMVNKQLWEIEDSIRKKEKNQEFDEEFIELARAVYYTNDQRAELKREINLKVGSALIEEKQYDQYV